MAALKANPTDIARFLTVLEVTPRRIAAAVNGLDEARLQTAPGDRQWSAIQVLAHLRACAELWGFSIHAMLVAENPVLPDLDERRWARVAGYERLDFRSTFQAFTLQREELLGVLRGLKGMEAWERSVEINGRRHTVFSQVRRLAKHETEHFQQIEETIRQPH